ncbi:uncharacterized protein LOC142765032 isoform X2 [Rhipicephalus microplus]|uniref:uncharacterized protein LOC142765032 isoform X2 n=1 Tax=Rhipicephalus microplus TaxID=6941 RepID=UPI003F6AD258
MTGMNARVSAYRKTRCISAHSACWSARLGGIVSRSSEPHFQQQLNSLPSRHKPGGCQAHRPKASVHLRQLQLAIWIDKEKQAGGPSRLVRRPAHGLRVLRDGVVEDGIVKLITELVNSGTQNFRRLFFPCT